MEKITILALHLGYGGIERCISSLANAFYGEYEIEIISTYKLSEHSAFYINPKVEITYLLEDLKPNHKALKLALLSKNPIKILKEGVTSLRVLVMRRKRMIKAIRKCKSDVIVSTRDIHNLWLGKYGSKKSVRIGWEHNHHNSNQKYIDKLVCSMQKLDYVVLATKELQTFYAEKLEKYNCKVVYIPNTIDDFAKEPVALENKKIISVGRLSKEKGYSDLIDVFNLVYSVYPDWSLDIVGDGLEFDFISNKVKELKLEDNIILHGFKNREFINALMLDSSINVMCSYTEAFGIVLIEAFAYGVPCIAFDSAQGATEIIENGINGFLVENRDKEEMANKICQLISQKGIRKELGYNAFYRAKDYSMNNVKKLWIVMFTS